MMFVFVTVEAAVGVFSFYLCLSDVHLVVFCLKVPFAGLSGAIMLVEHLQTFLDICLSLSMVTFVILCVF